MKWYEKPIAAIGAASLAYHEVLRGRRVGVCSECGRTNHAEAGRCLCGGEVDPAGPPGEFLEDPTVAEYDTFDTPAWRAASVVTQLAIAVGVLLLTWNGIARPGFVYGVTAVVLLRFWSVLA